MDLLRAHNAVLLSLVAAVENRVVGHILYSPVRLGSGPNELHGAALAPMAVLPQFQRHGIGSQLVAEGTRQLREANYPFIVVLGHPAYYPRFGFVPASRYGVRCQWQVADDAFMLLPLNPSWVSGMFGLARYRDEFAAVASDGAPLPPTDRQ